MAACPNNVESAWTVDVGGADSGQGQSGPIRVFGDKVSLDNPLLSARVDSETDAMHGQCLDVKDGGRSDGTRLQVWTCSARNSNPNQQFHVNGDATITWSGTDKCIDLPDGDQTVGKPVRLSSCSAPLQTLTAP